MPELPEVETIVRELRPRLGGARLTGIDVRLPKMAHVPVRTLRRRLLGTRVVSVQRRAKLVLIGVSSGWTVIIHLKMSGQLIWRPRSVGRLVVGGHPIPHGTEQLPNRYSHVMVRTDRGTLFFNDQRRFGFLKLVQTDALGQWLAAQGYGPEPLEAAFSFDAFNAILRRHARKRLKPTLLDQSVIAGVGNIYADEACHAARLRPMRRIATATVRERRALYRGLRRVMNLSIAHRGTSADSYRRANGQKGGMMPYLRVYGRDGRPCKRCGAMIVKTVLAGRGTHYCPNCQR